MKQKTADELKDLQGQQFNLVVVRRVPPTKGYLVALHFDQPIIGEGYSVGVTAPDSSSPFQDVSRGAYSKPPTLDDKDS